MKESKSLELIDIKYFWRGDVSDAELVVLIRSHGGQFSPGWWDRIRPYSLGWVTARLNDGSLAAFVNVAWDGCDHAFLLDTKTRGDLQRRAAQTRQRQKTSGAGRGCVSGGSGRSMKMVMGHESWVMSKGRLLLRPMTHDPRLMTTKSRTTPCF